MKLRTTAATALAAAAAVLAMGAAPATAATTTASTAAGAHVRSAAVVKEWLAGGYATVNGVRLYHHSNLTDQYHNPDLKGYVLPSKPNKAVQIYWQGLHNGHWTNIWAGATPTQANGMFGIHFFRLPEYVKFRVAAVYAGDASNSRSALHWQYFEVTR
ncbi:hypothetical protein ABIA32_003958 [Streptacidiphilus sp. MAP12-20]|uniref:hypothetical protein n=1 Tax=Streptacidiphilus sp. MAP12-20 TaxID=3156299 RepID=UPI003517E2AC